MIVASLWVWANRQLIQDWMIVQRYPVPSEVATIAKRAELTDYGRFIFYASEPEISDASTFNTRCDRQEAATAILGCYTSQRIFLYRITNKELDGIEEVTAAHEMLHAVWQRMSDGERSRLSKELEKAYEEVKTPELEERMAYYQRRQPGEMDNELHSILGTETENLSDELEQHYQKYFNDRHAITAFHNAYESVFASLEKKADELKQELEKEAPKINAAIMAHNAAVDDLNQAIIQHNNLAGSVNRRSTAAVNAYNAQRAAIQSEQTRLDQEQASLDARRKTYNKRLDEYNALVIRSTTLTDSIDSFKSQTNISNER